MDCTAVGAFSNGAGGRVTVNSCWLETATHYEVLSTLLHEFVHFTGLGDVTDSECANQTIMYMFGSPLTDLGSCDARAIESRLNDRDSDNDGSLDPDDCAPFDPSIYPGASINCSPSGEWADRDCSGGNDNYELSCDSNPSPLLVSTSDRTVALTDAAAGVLFDLNRDGVKERVSWTLPGSDDAWLALDRDGTGTITNGGELFGNFTPQGAGAVRNGFLALAVYDLPEYGGNNDGLIDRRDAVWDQLWLWTDANHDGVSDASELAKVSCRLSRISLDFRQRARVDRYGNAFRYWAKVTYVDSKLGWISDVYLVRDR